MRFMISKKNTSSDSFGLMSPYIGKLKQTSYEC
jgi:hypothetical protein